MFRMCYKGIMKCAYLTDTRNDVGHLFAYMSNVLCDLDIQTLIKSVFMTRIPQLYSIFVSSGKDKIEGTDIIQEMMSK